MKKISFITLLVAGFVLLNITVSLAGVPLNNLEGVGGVAFNPLAYTAGGAFETTDKEKDDPFSPKNVFSKPQFGGWYVSLGKANIDWTSIGLAETLFKRLELSYSHEAVAISNAETREKNNLGAKLLLVPENWHDNKFIPAFSVGSVFKRTSNVGVGIDASGVDYYAVATKLITLLPKPVLLSGGVLSTSGRVTGVLGYDDKRDTVGFGNIDLLPTKNTAIGFEYKQGAQFPTFKNADYWETHLAWFANKDLTLVLAYVNTGDRKSSAKTGFADGVVLSAQYQF